MLRLLMWCCLLLMDKEPAFFVADAFTLGSFVTRYHPYSKSLFIATSDNIPSSSSSKKGNKDYADLQEHRPQSRLDRTANCEKHGRQPCLLRIDGKLYNMTAWVKAHPGGEKVLHKFHNKDASKAFHAAAHSTAAYAMLREFEVIVQDNDDATDSTDRLAMSSILETTDSPTANSNTRRPRWQQKLFTKEDRVGFHKYLGLYCLLHFGYRYLQMYFGPDAAAGFASPSLWPVMTLIPHAILSLSSLIFHTVPRERVVGKPMIWREYRIHNIAFGIRSVICGILAWSACQAHILPRSVAATLSCVSALTAMLVADWGTRQYQPSKLESTTATMPYWEGCSLATQKRFKLFYAYSQFLATLACIAVANPAWPLSVLLAIQGASLLMTLVRKGIISAKAYHLGYTTTLVMPYLVGFRYGFVVDGGAHWFFPSMMGLGALMFTLRRRGVSKYALWLPVYALRIFWGGQYIPIPSAWM